MAADISINCCSPLDDEGRDQFLREERISVGNLVETVQINRRPGVLGAVRRRVRCGCGALAVQQTEFGEDIAQTIDLDRLGQVAVHAGRLAFLSISAHRIRRQRDDRYMSRLLQFANAARGGHAVHDRHLHIHQHDVKTRSLAGRHAFSAIAGDLDAAAQAFQEFNRDLLIDEIILHQQDLPGKALLRRRLSQHVAR